MKIKNVACNNRKKTFEIKAENKKKYLFPYSQLKLHSKNRIAAVHVDKELANEAFTYRLESGTENTILMDQVLAYNKDSHYLTEMLLYKLTVTAQKILKENKTSKREIIRRLKTSPTQFYRLIDQTYYHKTIDQMIKLLAALDYSVDVTFKKAA